MRASFVIVNYNRKAELLFTISQTKTLIKNNPDYEFVIVDNASLDGSAAAVKAAHPDVVLIENPVNTGAPAWNLGFKQAKGDYFIILDDDSHIDFGLEEALNHLDKHPEIGVLALNVVSGPYTSEGWKWIDGQNIVGFIGCGAILRRATYEKVGGYADWMFLYVNEWDLGLRVVDAGYQVRYFAGCQVTHRASAVNRSSKRLRIFVTRHELSIVYKYMAQDRSRYLWRVALNNLKGLRQLHFKDTWYNIIGMVEFLKNRPKLSYTPVTANTQSLFLERFEATRPVFAFLKRDLSILGKAFRKSSKNPPSSKTNPKLKVENENLVCDPEL
jgi:GT2 family glycosyltransferase